MEKIKINIGIIGYLPFEFNKKKVKQWKSDIFEICDISEYTISTQKSDTSEWEYSDIILNSEMPKRQGVDIFIGLTYIPIQDNYYARRLEDNRVIVSLFEIHKDIITNNLPIENLLLRVIYASSIIYFIEKNIPTAQLGRHKLLHDDTRGCIYDMTGNKSDVIYSLDKPKLCDNCIAQLRAKKVSNEVIAKVNKELKRIRKDRYHRIEMFVKKRPLLSLIITFVVGVAMSIVANYIYEIMKHITE